MNGLLYEFFSNVASAKPEQGQTCQQGQFVKLQVPIYAAKIAIDLMLHQIRSQIIAIAKILAEYTPINS